MSTIIAQAGMVVKCLLEKTTNSFGGKGRLFQATADMGEVASFHVLDAERPGSVPTRSVGTRQTTDVIYDAGRRIYNSEDLLYKAADVIYRIRGLFCVRRANPAGVRRKDIRQKPLFALKSVSCWRLTATITSAGAIILSCKFAMRSFWLL